MVWISKREISYYILLKKVFGFQPFNIGEAIDILRCFGSKRVALKVLKRLASKGFLVKIDIHTYRVNDMEKTFEMLLSKYIVERMYRYLKSSGVKIAIEEAQKPGFRVVIHGLDLDICKYGDKLGDIVRIECIKY